MASFPIFNLPQPQHFWLALFLKGSQQSFFKKSLLSYVICFSFECSEDCLFIFDIQELDCNTPKGGFICIFPARACWLFESVIKFLRQTRTSWWLFLQATFHSFFSTPFFLQHNLCYILHINILQVCRIAWYYPRSYRCSLYFFFQFCSFFWFSLDNF
jgi:hypothetical protein